MPLAKGKSKKTISHNIEELEKTYKEKGKIGTSHPKDKKAAQKQAVAIALNKSENESVMYKFDKRIRTILNESGAVTSQTVAETLTAISEIAAHLAGLYPQNTHPQQANADYQYYSIVRNKLDKHLLQIDNK